jgi:hypothetical protein
MVHLLAGRWLAPEYSCLPEALELPYTSMTAVA